MREINIRETTFTPDKPNVIANEQLEVYMPTASYETSGVSSFTDDDFIVEPNGRVHLRRSVTRAVANFSVDWELGILHINYDDGTSAELAIPTKTDALYNRYNLINEILFGPSAFSITDADGRRYALFDTGFDDDKFFVSLEMSNTQTVDGARMSGYTTVMDSIHKGDNGSVLLCVDGEADAFEGRLIFVGGSVFTDTQIVNIRFDADNNKFVVTKADGSEQDIEAVSKQFVVDRLQALDARKQDTLSFDGSYSPVSNKVATVRTVIDKIAEVVADAPDSFNTLKEIADWIKEHPNSVAELNASINQRVNKLGVPNRLYGTNSKGADRGYEVSTNLNGESVPMRNEYGAVQTAMPKAPLDAANMDYVNNLPDYLELTPSQLAKWCNWLDVIKNPKPLVNSVVTVVADNVGTIPYANYMPYADRMYVLADESKGDTIAGDGYTLVNDPKKPYHAVNKRYIDNLPDFLELTTEQKAKWKAWIEKLGIVSGSGGSSGGNSEKEIAVVDIDEMMQTQNVTKFIEFSNKIMAGDCIVMARLGTDTVLVDTCTKDLTGNFAWRGTVFNYTGSADGFFVNPDITAFRLQNHGTELLDLLIEPFPLVGKEIVIVDVDAMYTRNDVDKFFILSQKIILGDCVVIAYIFDAEHNVTHSAIIDNCQHWGEFYAWRGFIFTNEGMADGEFANPSLTGFELRNIVSGYGEYVLELNIAPVQIGGDRDYVDERIGEINVALDHILEIQDTLISGGNYQVAETTEF